MFWAQDRVSSAITKSQIFVLDWILKLIVLYITDGVFVLVVYIQGRQNDTNREFRVARDQGKLIISPHWLTAVSWSTLETSRPVCDIGVDLKIRCQTLVGGFETSV